MTFKFDAPEVAGVSARVMTPAATNVRAHAYLRVLNRLAERYTLADVTDHSPFAPYLTFDPSRGDMGLILEDERRLPVASMWVSFITAKGFVADSVPEMVVSVEPNWRGKGIGGWLIKQAVNYGRTHGWQGISVSVESESPARRLYARNEFVTQNDEGVMLRTLSPLITAVTVYCGSVMGERPEFAEAAAELGTELARRNIIMVYGGASVGLMGEAASACLAAGGEVIGVMPRGLADLELVHPHLSRLELTDDILARKTRMEELADAFVALPGGMGTLEEVSEVLVRQQLGPYTGPVALYNVEDYWTPFLTALRAMEEEGFIWERYLDAIVVADSLDGLFDGFNRWANPGLKWRKGGLRNH